MSEAKSDMAPAIARAEALGQAPSSLLPAAEALPRHLVACGRALLGWSLPANARAPVLMAMGWAADASHHAIFNAHADWAHQALEAALNDTAPPPESSDTGAAPELEAATERPSDGADQIE